MSYKLIKHLGSGAFGSVDKCETPPGEPFYREHPVVAIKRVRYAGGHAEREAEILRRLDHEGCVKLLTSFRDNTDLCLVQEFCDGGDLSSGKVTRDEFVVWRIIFQLAGALQYIHSLNILHRDIKPANILIKSVGETISFKLADFGLSKLMDRVHYGSFYATSRCGTYIYMSPEALSDDRRYGKASDIWSLGAVISFVCNRSHLFRKPQDVFSWPGGRSSLDRGKYSIELRQLVADMLCPDPALRPRAGKVLTEVQKKTPLQEVPGFPNWRSTNISARLAAPPPALVARSKSSLQPMWGNGGLGNWGTESSLEESTSMGAASSLRASQPSGDSYTSRGTSATLGAIPKTPKTKSSLDTSSYVRTGSTVGTYTSVGTTPYSDTSSLMRTNCYGYTNPSIETLCSTLKHTGIVNYDYDYDDDDDDDDDDGDDDVDDDDDDDDDYDCSYAGCDDDQREEKEVGNFDHDDDHDYPQVFSGYCVVSQAGSGGYRDGDDADDDNNDEDDDADDDRI